MKIGMIINVPENYRMRIANGEAIDDWGFAIIWVSNTIGYELNLCWDGENCSAYYKIEKCDEEDEEIDIDTSNPIPCTVDFAADDWEQQLARELLGLAWR